jgi:hypothetical protein
MTSLRQLRSFSAEMMKIAADVQDPGIQELLAFRRGEEYLPGGQLPSNTALEEYYQPKMAAGFDSRIGLATDAFDLKARKKKHNQYQTVRDYATTGMKGGLTGIGLLGAANALRGRFGSPQGPVETFKAMRNVRRAAGAGVGVALLDRAYRHDDLPDIQGKDKTAGIVRPTANGLRSPAAQLSQAQATGSFKNVIRSTEGRAPHSLQTGKKFRLA